MPFRCFPKHNLTKARLSDALNSRRWRFLQSDPDDFRAGLPPLSRSTITQPTRGPVPILLPMKPEALRKTQPRSKRMTFKPQSRISKQRARKEIVAETEYCLSRHPLALYPHLAESIPLELFREVVEILDPEMLPLNEEEVTDMEQESLASSASQPPLEGRGKRKAKPKKLHKSDTPLKMPVTAVGETSGTKRPRPQSHSPDNLQNPIAEPSLNPVAPLRRPHFYSSKEPKSKDPYTWFSKREVAAREREARLNYVPPLDDNVQEAIKEFCRWFDSLGGEKYNVDEAAIVSLFDTRYETKPPLLIPVHVVELNNLPAELRKYMGTPAPQDPVESPALPGSQSKELYQPKREKIRYGAWYLDPKTWKKQKANEPLEDPQLEDESIKKARKIWAEMDAEIVELHGTHAFKEFLEKKGYRIPEFLQQMLAVQNALGPKTRAVKGSRNKFQRHKLLQENASPNTANE